MNQQFYSQFGEDYVIYPIFQHQKEGFYVDLGAYDGILESNTYLFDLMGWNGICVEPVSTLYQQLKRNRPRSTCLNVAIWGSNQSTCNFNVLVKRGWSRMENLHHPEIESPVYKVEHPATQTLNSILEFQRVPRGFDLLSIDVEGSEPQVLEGFNLESYLPRIVIIENWFKNREFDSFFEGYTPVCSWEQGSRSTNIIYCREPEDAETVLNRWDSLRSA